jgi:murein DD-endopeptidase MepM/ murein hydrolase activator NlpD
MMNGKRRSFYIAAFTAICAAGIVTIADRQDAKTRENANQIKLAQEGDRVEDDNLIKNPNKEPSKDIWDDNINLETDGDMNDLDDDADEGDDTADSDVSESKKPIKGTEEGKVPTKKPEDVQSVTATIHSFDEEEGLFWPVNGEVIMKYSMEAPVFYQTTQTFRTSDGILIKAEKGGKVVASSDGVIKDIYTSDERGNVIEMDIGNGYTISYGQLENVCVKVGDEVLAEQKLGEVAQPTSYYNAEGSHIYMQVKEKDTQIDPLLLLN